MGQLGLVRMGWLVEGVFAEGGNRVRRANDMKSSVVMVAIVSIWDFIFMLLSLDMVLCIEGYLYILHVTLSRLIVLYSRCRVNRGTNMSVVYVLSNFSLLLPLHIWASMGHSQPVGCIPTELQSASYQPISRSACLYAEGTPTSQS